LGGIFGIFLRIPGILLGPFAGAVIGELSLQCSLDEEGRAGFFRTVVGLAIGVNRSNLGSGRDDEKRMQLTFHWQYHIVFFPCRPQLPAVCVK
jgi:hypothetical protein